MRCRHAIVGFVLSLSLVDVSFAAEKAWLTGRVVNIESQMISAGYERRFYHIDPGEDLIYVAFEKGYAQSANAYAQIMSFGLAPKRKKFADLTVNDPVRFAIQGKSLFLLDEKGKETKLELYNKVRKTAPAAATPPADSAAAPSPAPAASSAEIRRGMTPEEVEQALGKPQRTVSFEGRTQWLYAKLVVVFEQGQVSDVSF
jgi:hypothetical protein